MIPAAAAARFVVDRAATVAVVCAVGLLGAAPLARAQPTTSLGFFQAIGVASGPEAMAMSPDGRHLYVLSYGSDTLTVLLRNGPSGLLFFVQSVQNGVGGVQDMDGPTALDVSPDGKHLYVVCQLDDSLVVFARDETSGQVAYVQSRVDGVGGFGALGGARDVAVSGDGAHVYVAAPNDDAVAILGRNAISGGVTALAAVVDTPTLELDGANQVLVTADGFVIVGAANDLGVQVFARSPTTGALTQWQEVSFAPSSTVTGIVLSPGRDKVYFADYFLPGIRIFNRSTGGLLGGLIGFLGNEPLATPGGIAMSPDGRDVYATSTFANALVAYRRDAASGDLERTGSAVDGTAGVDGLASPSTVLVSPDGRHVYVSGFADSKIAAFRRSIFADGFESNDLLAWPRAVGAR